MTIRDYIENPMGKGSAVGNPSMMKHSLNNAYNELRKYIKIKTFIYKNNLIYLIKIPSRKTTNVMYDVILEFPMEDINDASILSVSSLPFKCYSNCMSFTYTFAKVFYDKELLCGWLLKKYDKIVLKKNPATRNPYAVITFERSLYMAIKYVLEQGRDRISYIKTTGIIIKGYQSLYKLIKSQSEIENIYEREVTLVEQNERRETKREVDIKRMRRENEEERKEQNKTKYVQKTNKVNKTKTMKTNRTRKL